MMAKIPLKGLVEREVLKVMEQMYAADGEERPLSEKRESGAVQRFAERYGDEVFGVIARVQGLGDALRRRARGLFKRR
jgi:hypothetical protein